MVNSQFFSFYTIPSKESSFLALPPPSNLFSYGEKGSQLRNHYLTLILIRVCLGNWCNSYSLRSFITREKNLTHAFLLDDSDHQISKPCRTQLNFQFKVRSGTSRKFSNTSHLVTKMSFFNVFYFLVRISSIRKREIRYARCHPIVKDSW